MLQPRSLAILTCWLRVARPPRRLRTPALALESLEDRTVPSLLGSQFTVNENLINSQRQSASASDRQGDTVAVWNDNGDIVGCYFNRIGNRMTDSLGHTDFTIANSSLDEFEPAVAMDHNGDFVVTWTETESNGDQRVRAQLFDSTRTPIGSAFNIAAGLGRHDHEAKVGMDTNGDFVVSYTSDGEVRIGMYFWDGSLNQDFTASGRSSAVTFHASSIACASDGGFALAYQADFHNPASSVVFLEQYNALGESLQSQQWGSVDATAGVAIEPCVSVDNQGNPAFACLIQATGTTSWSVKAGQGLRFGMLAPLTIIVNNSSADQTPVIAADPFNSNYVVADKQPGGGNQVWITEVTTSGTTSVPLDFAQDFSNLAVSVNDDHRYLVTYTSTDDFQQTGSEIIGQFGQLGDLFGSPVFLSLADHVLTATGTSSVSNTITMTYNGSPGLAVTVNGTEFDLSWSDASGGIILNGDQTPYTFNVEDIVGGTPVTINTGTGNDAINVSPVAQVLPNIDGSLTVNGGGGIDTLQMFDSKLLSSFGPTYNLQFDSLRTDIEPHMAINYSNIANVMLATCQNESSQSTTINVQGHVASSSVTIVGNSGPDSLVVSLSASNPLPPPGLSFDGGGGPNTLVLLGDASSSDTYTATGPASGTIALSTLYSGTSTISYANVQSVSDPGIAPGRFSLANYLTFNASGVGDILSVVDGPVISGFQSTRITSNGATFTTLDFANRSYVTLNTLDGSDTVTLNNPHPEASLFSMTVAGGVGANTLVGPDQVSTWVINAFNAGTLGSIKFNNFQNLVGGAANDIFQFTGSGSVAGTVNGGGGTQNRLDYSGNGGTPVTVNLQTAAAPRIKAGNPGGFSNIQLLRAVSSPSNTLTGPNANSLWTITGTNIGSVGSFAFVGIENLVGGTGVDTFRFGPMGSIASIRGGGNRGDWLDYSPLPFTMPVTVNLATGSATRVGGGAAGALRGIQNVTGSAGNDRLTGNSLGNILIGGPGDDTIFGGTGRSILIGDGGNDAITGGAADDILIGGRTTFDVNAPATESALISILAEWQRTDKSYVARISDLRNGGGLNGSNKLARGVTVLDDGAAADTLRGDPPAPAGAGLDWFFQFAGDTILDPNRGGAETIN
jgi:hypothetical protein